MRAFETKVFLALCTFIVAMLMSPLTAMAQTDNELLVDVPFNFVAGDRTLPAGTYRVDVLPESTTDGPAIITLQTEKESATHQMIFQSVTTRSVDVNDTGWKTNPMLKFEKVGSMYFLAEVDLP